MSSITFFPHRVLRIVCAVAVWALWSATAYGQSALLDMPTRVAVDAQSNVFVVENTARQIAKFNAGGVLITRFGGSGTAPGQFVSVQDIATDPSGNVLVLDRAAKKVLRFTNGGTFIDLWQLFPSASPTRAHSLVVDAIGRLFVSDDNGGAISVFSPTGQFVTGLPVISGQPGNDTPGDLALDGSGNLYVVDRANQRILKFGTAGPANNPLTWLGWIGGCTAGTRCQAIPGGAGAPSRTTGWCTDFSQCGDSRRGSGKGRFDNPVFVSAAANGALNVSDVGSGAIQRFDASGAYVGDLALRGRMPGQTGGTDATAVGPNGDIYTVQTLLGRVSRFTANGTFAGVFGGGVELSVFPGDTAINPLKYLVPSTQASTIGVTSIGGYTGPLSLESTRCLGPKGPPPQTCSSLDIATSFNNPAVTVTPGGAATTLSITVSPATPDGLSLVVVDSATAGVPAFAQVAIDVKLQRKVTAVPTPSTITIMPGDQKTPVDIEVSSINVSGSTSLSAAFMPSPAAGHMSYAVTPSGSFVLPVNGMVHRTLDVTALAAARTANYTLNVTATTLPTMVKATSPILVKVECNCSDTGDFVLPSVRPVTATSGLSGTSPDGQFVVTGASTMGGSASVSVAALASPNVVLVAPVSSASSWGFSPDSRFFLVTRAGPSTHITMLDIFDLDFQNRRVVAEQITACPVGDPICLPPASFCYAGAGSPANSACTGGGSATKTSNFNVSNAAWGFGPDSKSFVIAAVNPLVSSSQVRLTLYNLATGAAPAIVSTAGPAISSFWQFSPCGDLFMHFQQLFATPSSNDEAVFYRTASTTAKPPSNKANLIVGTNGAVASGPVGARVEPAFFSNGDFDVRLLNLSHASGSPATGFQSPQCQRR